MAKLYEYETCCVHTTAKAIHEMKDAAVEVSYETMKRNCEGFMDWAESMSYVRHPNSGLTLKNDWGVAYFKSTYKGGPCFFLVHSAIEYIWTRKIFDVRAR